MNDLTKHNNKASNNDLRTLLPAVFSDLQEYVIEEKEGYIKLNIPIGLIDFDRHAIRANFKDCAIHWERGRSHNIVELFHK